MEKGNEPEQGEGTAEQPGQPETGTAPAGSSADPGTGTGTAPATDGASSAGQGGGGGGQAGQQGPTRERNPWAGTPNLGETTLPDGTKLRRDADGRFWRGPDRDGRENVWDPEEGRWMKPDTWRQEGGAGWQDPNDDWHEAWTGDPLPEGWRDVPREGSTYIPEGTISRDAAGNYSLNTPDGQTLRWNEQTGKWYDAGTGRESGHTLDPVDGWKRGADIDANVRAHPEQGGNPYRPQPGTGSGQMRP